MGRCAWAAVLFALACGDDAPATHASGSSDTSGSDSSSPTDGGSQTGADTGSSGGDESSTTGGAPLVPGEGPFGGGTRLRAVVEHGDGAARLLHWYDTELGIECQFARDAAGDLRCLPVRSPGVRVGYSDEGCNEGVLQVESCGAAPGFVRSDAVGSVDCETGPRQVTFRRGGPIAPPDDFSDWSGFSGSCSGSGPPIGNHYAIDRVDDRDFLAAAIVDEIGEGPLGVRSFVAEDGSWERAELLDAATGRLCTKGYEFVGEMPVSKCMLQGSGKGGVFNEPECDGTLLFRLADDGTCDLPTFASDGVDWWELGERYEGDVWAMSGGECTTFPVDVEVEALFERGAAIDPPVFAEYVRTPVPADAGDRLQPYGLEIDGVATLLTRVDDAWYDATLDAPCSAIELPDGGQICAHDTMNGPPDEWGDPECSMIPLARMTSAEPPPIVVRVEFDGCRSVAQDAQAVFGVWKGDVHELDPETGACIPMEADGWTFLQLGNTVQLADLPPLVVETLDGV